MRQLVHLPDTPHNSAQSVGVKVEVEVEEAEEAAEGARSADEVLGTAEEASRAAAAARSSYAPP